MQDAATEERLVAALGPGGFIPQEFQLIRRFGTASIQTDTLSSSSSLGDATSSSSTSTKTTLLAYAARYQSGLPYEGPVTVLLKEYLPGCKAVACHEIEVLQRLLGDLPTNKWKVGGQQCSAICRMHNVNVACTIATTN